MDMDATISGALDASDKIRELLKSKSPIPPFLGANTLL